jgi:hypothetical protein
MILRIFERLKDRKFVKWDESCLRLDDECWNEFRDYCVAINFRWEGYNGDNWGLCNTCESIIEEKVRKVFYPTQDEIIENIYDQIEALQNKITNIEKQLDKILELLSK